MVHGLSYPFARLSIRLDSACVMFVSKALLPFAASYDFVTEKGGWTEDKKQLCMHIHLF